MYTEELPSGLVTVKVYLPMSLALKFLMLHSTRTKTLVLLCVTVLVVILFCICFPSFSKVNVSGGEPSEVHLNVRGSPSTPLIALDLVVIFGAPENMINILNPFVQLFSGNMALKEKSF